MKKFHQFCGHVRMLHGVFIVALLVVSAVQSKAQTYDISAANASLQIDLSGANAGLSDWTLNGVNQLEQQWFYYSIGSGPVESINMLTPSATPSVSTSSLSETYSSSMAFVNTSYSLGSPVSGASQLHTSILIQNLTGSTQTFHLYQYSDFDLNNISGGQSVQFLQPGLTSSYEVVQTGNNGNLTGTLSALGGGGLASVEEVAGVYDGTQFGITNGNPVAPIFNNSSLSASGNVNFAYEFDATLTANSSISVSEFQTVPEPAPLSLISLGMLGFALFYGRRLAFLKKS